jgi:hypothetical protein
MIVVAAVLNVKEPTLLSLANRLEGVIDKSVPNTRKL